jgi:AcrR family transcriptional regulator
VRRRILDAAAQAFQSHGYHSTSTHDLVRAARVTGGALHHHFPTKKELGLAVIRERVAQSVEETWIGPVQSAATAMEGILDAFELIAAGIDKRKAVLGCPLNNLATELSLADPDFRAAVHDIYEKWQATIAQKLRLDRTAGALRERLDPDMFATFLIASYSGAISLAKVRQDSAPLRECARQLVTALECPAIALT